VNVTIHNAGTLDAGAFSLKLDVYWKTGSSADGSGTLAVANLSAGASITVQFTAVFHPTHAHYYELTATVDSQNEILENNEANNLLVYCPGSGIKVTVIGDINNDTGVSILDAVTIAQAWGATPSDGWWDIRADINHDCIVNILDATRMALNWGSTW
jgi:subtilase family serine protease